MNRFLVAALVAASAACVSARADAQEAQSVIDKAIQALGGEEKLAGAKALTWKSVGKVTFGDATNEFHGKSTVQGLDRLRSEFEGEFNGNAFKGVTVLAGDKGWRKFGEDRMAMDADALANEKRNVYLQLVPTLLVPLKGPGFKAEAAGEEVVGGKPAVVLKVTGPDGKDFRLSFDKESGLPVKEVAKVVGFGGEEFVQEATYGNYKDFGGIKKATKVDLSRDGQKFLEMEVGDFRVLEKVEPGTFDEPS